MIVASVVDPATVAGYERLRRGALGETVDEPGLLLLMRRGLRAWIEARETAATHAKPAPASSADHSPGVYLRDELARLLATMALCAGRKEAQP